jgi:peptidoglycan/LPS O-acetylase OafA/YrhL
MTDVRAWRYPFRVSAGLALVAGLLLFAGATRTDDFFSWTIDPPLTAAFLGAAYWAAAVLFIWASAQREWSAMRIAALPELTVAVLLLIATQLHLDKFHSDVFGYFWVAVYAIAAPVLIYLLASQAGGRPDPAPGPPMPGWLRLLLGAQAALFGVYGVGLFFSPSGFDGAWPWPLTPLTAQAVAAFLLGFGLAAAIAVRANSLRRFRGAALAYAVLGSFELLAALLHSGDFEGAMALPAFLVCAASVLAAGLAGTMLDGPGQASRSRRARSGS